MYGASENNGVPTRVQNGPVGSFGCRGGSRYVEGCWGVPYSIEWDFMFAANMSLAKLLARTNLDVQILVQCAKSHLARGYLAHCLLLGSLFTWPFWVKGFGALT